MLVPRRLANLLDVGKALSYVFLLPSILGFVYLVSCEIIAWYSTLNTFEAQIQSFCRHGRVCGVSDPLVG